ncbi:response regulator transcription factor [Bacillus luteolus]|uniref:Response regulator transcription factor n=1 Tax=Litchfieldia luteola TaxID=682179 RepID=A0ABR9QFA4_9BACI|nr:response regulator transcription factor [Cytobacillus luteolus]MBE4907173.1 response regulator transcription factor [Cytobacillus luteolus]MBP1943356.1 DNA-binding NarL/FixJ family response regulator [Cytobacillus luteolus]
MSKVLIIDDHPLVRQGIQTIISMGQNLEFVGEASSIREALSLLEETKPDVALVDLNLGKEYGLDLVKQATERGYKGKFIIVTSSSTKEDIKKAKTGNVDGFCLKDAMPEDLLYAIEVVLRGRKYYDPALMEYMMDNPVTDVDNSLDELTPKELEVLKALGKGMSNKEIAEDLFITEYTVKKHVSQILSKLDLADRTQAALFANAKGIVQFDLHHR